MLPGTVKDKDIHITTFILETHPYLNPKTGKIFHVPCLSPTWTCPHCSSTEEYPPNIDKLVISLYRAVKGGIYYVVEPSDTVITKTTDTFKCLMSHAAGFKHAFSINSFTFLKSYPAGAMLYSSKIMQDTFKIARDYTIKIQERY